MDNDLHNANTGPYEENLKSNRMASMCNDVEHNQPVLLKPLTDTWVSNK